MAGRVEHIVKRPGGHGTKRVIIRAGDAVTWLQPRDIATELRKMRAQIDSMLSLLGEGPKLAPVTALYMTTAAYAKRRNVSESTVKRWVKAGLPHTKIGRTVRIEVAAADAWESL